MKKFLLGIFVLLVLGALATAGFVYTLFQPVNSTQTELQRFTVPKGQAISVIGQRLTDQGLIKHPLVFRFIVQQQNLQNQIQAGSFEVSPAMSPAEIAQVLTEGTDDVWITVVEGWRVEEIADMLERQDLPEFDKDAFLLEATKLEGYLYPDTYLVPKLATSETLLNLFTTTFELKIEQALADEIAAAEAEGKSLEEAVIMASLLEREAQGFEDMQHVAGILQNRLDIDMALQVDATMQYVNGYDPIQDSWWVPPTAADKQLDSPYNTYQVTGLPPAPIANPGQDAIRAALDPLDTPHFFYIHDRQGMMHYAEDLAGHNANVDRYLR